MPPCRRRLGRKDAGERRRRGVAAGRSRDCLTPRLLSPAWFVRTAGYLCLNIVCGPAWKAFSLRDSSHVLISRFNCPGTSWVCRLQILPRRGVTKNLKRKLKGRSRRRLSLSIVSEYVKTFRFQYDHKTIDFAEKTRVYLRSAKKKSESSRVFLRTFLQYLWFPTWIKSRSCCWHCLPIVVSKSVNNVE